MKRIGVIRIDGERLLAAKLRIEKSRSLQMAQGGIATRRGAVGAACGRLALRSTTFARGHWHGPGWQRGDDRTIRGSRACENVPYSLALKTGKDCKAKSRRLSGRGTLVRSQKSPFWPLQKSDEARVSRAKFLFGNQVLTLISVWLEA